jgi:5-methylcytosine-specific restriction endonuclease McrA
MSRPANFVSKKIRLAIYRRDGYKCIYCLRSLKSDDILLSLDHILPESLGGKHDTHNLVTCCHSCNSKRGNKDIYTVFGGWALRRVNRQASKPIDAHILYAAKLLKSLNYHDILDSIRGE